jgi:hypothetical protein
VTVAAPAASRRRTVLGAVVLVVVVVVVGLLASGTARRSGPELSPTSDAPDGTSGFLLLLQEVGASPSVVAAVPGPDDATALLLKDTMSDDQRASLARWVEQGGDLVVADPGSALAARVGGDLNEGDRIERGQCDLPGAGKVASIRTAQGVADLSLAPPVRYRAVEGGTSCFDRYVVRQARGAGTITSVGGAEPFVNGLLATDDGSTLALDLLAPTDAEHVAVIDVVPQAGTGSESLLDLIAPRVTQAFGLAVVAFVVFAIHRGRRLGRPVIEHQRVAIPGSGLVTAVGRLQQRTGASDRAAAALRADTRRAIVRQLGLPATATPTTIGEVVAARTGLDAARVASALADGAVPDERWLVALTNELDRIRQEVLHVRQ